MNDDKGNPIEYNFSKRRLLALDPGITTGWAVLDGEKILECGTLIEEDFGTWEGRVKAYRPDGVVIEETPVPTLGRMNLQLKRIIGSLDRMFPHAVKVQPGTWKNSPIAEKGIAIVGSLETHTRDAIRLGWYVLATNHDFEDSGTFTTKYGARR